MNEPTESIRIETEKLKPIRCKGKTIPTMSLLNADQRRTMCQGTVLGLTDGQVLILNQEGIQWVSVSGEKFHRDTRGKRKLGDVAKELKTEFEIDGNSYLLESYAIGGRSLTIICSNCGTSRRMVGINIFVDVPGEELDSVHFK